MKNKIKGAEPGDVKTEGAGAIQRQDETTDRSVGHKSRGVGRTFGSSDSFKSQYPVIVK